MKITDMLLTNKNARPGKKITPRGVVIHWTANENKGADAIANRGYFNKPTTVASAHYIVDGKQIVRCLPENEMGYHVGAKSYKPDAIKQLSSYPNDCTIGIEMCVNQDGDFMTMYQRTIELAADILKRYGWGVDRLWRHFDITGKNCPAYFVSDDVARRLTGLLASQAWSKFKEDVHKLLTDYPQKKEDKKEPVSIALLLTAQGYVTNGVSFLPIRAVAEAVGASVEYNATTKQVQINGKDITEIIEKGIAYAPSRELGSLLALQVEWEGTSKTVTLKGAQ